MRYHLVLIFGLVLVSCQEEITLKLPQSENTLVVEGAIEPGFPPYVMLTKNQGYFDEIDINTYNELFVNNADTVKVWYFNEIGEKKTKILESITALDSFPPIYTDLNYDWSGNSNYEFSQENRTYYLEIKWNNQTITAETFIPESTPLDCLWVEQRENASKEYKFDIRAVYSDPANKQNYLFSKSKRLQHYTFNEENCTTKNKPDFPLKIIDAGADVLVNGTSFEFYFGRPNEGGFPTGAYNTNHEKECLDGTILERDHDIVLIKFCQIDEPSLKFWRGLIRQAGTNGNPFAEPLNLVSNINGGLGIWTGYSPVYYKVPIIKDTVIFEQYIPNIEDIF